MSGPSKTPRTAEAPAKPSGMARLDAVLAIDGMTNAEMTAIMRKAFSLGVTDPQDPAFAIVAAVGWTEAIMSRLPAEIAERGQEAAQAVRSELDAVRAAAAAESSAAASAAATAAAKTIAEAAAEIGQKIAAGAVAAADKRADADRRAGRRAACWLGLAMAGMMLIFAMLAFETGRKSGHAAGASEATGAGSVLASRKDAAAWMQLLLMNPDITPNIKECMKRDFQDYAEQNGKGCFMPLYLTRVGFPPWPNGARVDVMSNVVATTLEVMSAPWVLLILGFCVGLWASRRLKFISDPK